MHNGYYFDKDRNKNKRSTSFIELDKALKTIKHPRYDEIKFVLDRDILILRMVRNALIHNDSHPTLPIYLSLHIVLTDQKCH
jgi:hypothetical protein